MLFPIVKSEPLAIVHSVPIKYDDIPNLDFLYIACLPGLLNL